MDEHNAARPALPAAVDTQQRRPMLYPVELRPRGTDDLTGTAQGGKGDEEWRHAERFPPYEVSNLGRVRRGTRLLKATRKTGRRGFPPYLVVKLCFAGIQRQVRLNRLVARTWLGRPPRGKPHADHKDGDTFNNRAGNLEWVSQGENQRRSHALHPRARDARGRVLPRQAVRGAQARGLVDEPVGVGRLVSEGVVSVAPHLIEAEDWALDFFGENAPFEFIRYSRPMIHYKHAHSDLMVLVSGRREADGKRWIHVSLSYPDKLPGWGVYRMVKDRFIGRDKKALQVLPAQSEYVNIAKNALHMWHCVDGDGLPDFRFEGAI